MNNNPQTLSWGVLTSGKVWHTIKSTFYTVVHKKRTGKLLSITSANLNRFQ